jgi:hypothetical protein
MYPIRYPRIHPIKIIIEMEDENTPYRDNDEETHLLVSKSEESTPIITETSPKTPIIPKLDIEQHEEEIYENALSYSESIVSILIPVTLTMLITIWAIQVLSPILYKIPIFASLAGGPATATATAGYSLWLQLGLAVLYSVVFVVAIIVVTFLLLCLYKLRWMFVIGIVFNT